jgi:hypothetical protein
MKGSFMIVGDIEMSFGRDIRWTFTESPIPTATAATAGVRETLLDNFLRAGSTKFTPRENFAGDLIGENGVKVEA